MKKTTLFVKKYEQHFFVHTMTKIYMTISAKDMELIFTKHWCGTAFENWQRIYRNNRRHQSHARGECRMVAGDSRNTCSKYVIRKQSVTDMPTINYHRVFFSVITHIFFHGILSRMLPELLIKIVYFHPIFPHAV